MPFCSNECRTKQIDMDNIDHSSMAQEHSPTAQEAAVHREATSVPSGSFSHSHSANCVSYFLRTVSLESVLSRILSRGSLSRELVTLPGPSRG